MSLRKNFKMPYNEAHELQFHADFLDAFNHANLGSIGSTTSASPTLIIGAPQYGGSPTPTAGMIFKTSGSYRVIQLGLRYRF